MKKVMLVFGTRPEAIKMCPLVKEFQKHPTEFETIVCVTGQHREMLDQVKECKSVEKVTLPGSKPFFSFPSLSPKSCFNHSDN